jgi:hypothetical protein
MHSVRARRYLPGFFEHTESKTQRGGSRVTYDSNEIARHLDAVARRPLGRGFTRDGKSKILEVNSLAEIISKICPEEWQQDKAQAFETAIRQAICRLEGSLTPRMLMQEAGYWLFNLAGGEPHSDIEPLYLDGVGKQKYSAIKDNLAKRAGLPGTINASTVTTRIQELRIALAKELIALSEDDRRSRLCAAKRKALPEGTPWPFRLIEPRAEGIPELESLLDGSVLTPDICHAGGAADRRVMHDGEELGIADSLSWLASQSVRTVFLYGDRGDGKTSYINLLAARSLETHIFLRWERIELGFDVGQLEEYRERVVTLMGGRPSDSSPTVVVVYSLPPYGDDDAEQRLVRALRVRQHDRTDRVIVLVEGRRGDLDRLADKVRPECISLAPINRMEADQWAQLLKKAHSTATSKGMAPEKLAAKYPHLPEFLQLDRNTQEEHLADSTSPLIVKLLQAVYGEGMWTKLREELEDLEQEDRKAYMHICMASMAGGTLPDTMLTVLAPGSDLDDRSNRDPWIRNSEGRHSARHQYIAQVVLEKSWIKRRTLLQECVNDLVKHLRSGREYGDVLRQVALAVREVDHVSRISDRDGLRNILLTSIRRALSEVESLDRLLHSQAPTDYWHHAAWAQVLSDLAADPETGLALLRANDKLLSISESLPECPNHDRVTYYRVRNRVRRLKMVDEFDFDAACEAVTLMASTVHAEWREAGFYVDLFSWSRDALQEWGIREFEGENIDRGELLYKKLGEALEWYRALTPEAEQVERFSKQYGSLVAGPLHYQLPAKALALLKHSWQFSVDLENPNSRTGELYAEALLDRRNRGASTSPSSREEAVQVLRIVLDSPLIPSYAPYLLVTNTKEEDLPREWFLERIEVAGSGAINGEARGYLTHARALAEQDLDKRIPILLDAIKHYAKASHDRRRGGEARGFSRTDTRMSVAWDRACGDLQRVGFPKWSDHRKQYQRFSAKYRP